jgi:hypothetical protein
MIGGEIEQLGGEYVQLEAQSVTGKMHGPNVKPVRRPCNTQPMLLIRARKLR